MARLIGIDYGQRRVGLAVTDPLHLIATPLKTIKTTDVLLFLQSYVAKESVEAMIVGPPFI
jgi:putative Holliday junction resolvase